MDVRIRSETARGTIRHHAYGPIREVIINEDLQTQESISLCFRSSRSSGIVTLGPKEIEMVVDAAMRTRSLITKRGRVRRERV